MIEGLLLSGCALLWLCVDVWVTEASGVME